MKTKFTVLSENQSKISDYEQAKSAALTNSCLEALIIVLLNL